MYRVMVKVLVNRHDPDSDSYSEEYSGNVWRSWQVANEEAGEALKLLADDPNVEGVYVEEV